MGKKKILKEIEDLKLQIENLKNDKIKIREKQFNEDFETAIKLLEKHGHISWQIDYERNDMFMDIITRRKYTLVLDC